MHERIEKKVDKIGEDIGEIKVTLAAQHESLKDHMRRVIKFLGLGGAMAAIVKVILMFAGK